MNMKLQAVLSTTVLPLDGVYQVETLPAGNLPDIVGVPHYIGHPDTLVIWWRPWVQSRPRPSYFPVCNRGKERFVSPFSRGKAAVPPRDLQPLISPSL